MEPPGIVIDLGTTLNVKERMSAVMNRFKRKPHRPLGVSSVPPRSLEEKVNGDMGGQTGSALETNPFPDSLSGLQQRTAASGTDGDAGLYGQRRNRSYSLRRSRNFPTLPTLKNAQGASVRSVAGQSTSSRFSRFSKSTSTTVNGGVRTMMTVSTAAVHVVCAISENQARETCVSSIDAGSPAYMHVSKQGNNQMYEETLAYLEMLQPDEVLLNEGRRNSQLAKKVLELYNVDSYATIEVPIGDNRRRNAPSDGTAETETNDDGNTHHPRNGEPSTVVKFVSRTMFDQTSGAQLVEKIARAETYDATLMGEYIILSSAHAVLQFIQKTMGVTFLKNSLYLCVNAAGNNRLAMDRSTMLQLELLVNAKTGKVHGSLVGAMDSTKTSVGSRLLRTNLMSPPTQADTINSRLELVELFLMSSEFFYAVMNQLSRLPDIDKVLSNIALIPRKIKVDKDGAVVVNKRTQQRMASKGIAALVCIKTTLQALPSFAHTLHEILGNMGENIPQDMSEHNDDTTIATERTTLLVGLGDSRQDDESYNRNRRHNLLRGILFGLARPGLATVLEAVTDIFTDETAYSRNPHIMKHRECYAFKCTGGLLSILRSSFERNVDEIYKKADEYAELHGISVTVRFSVARGYFLAIPAAVGRELPNIFVQPLKSGKFITCSTREVTALNNKVQDTVHELLMLTHDRIQEAMEVARMHYDAVADLCDSIALLDMCQSFADNVLTTSGSTMKWCRPIVSERLQKDVDDDEAGSMIITNGRNPIVVSDFEGQGPSGLVPNDTYANEGKFFTVITGINGSGKSTYLKQIAIITIMAHCGAFVTAESAVIPVRDRICCRIGNADDPQHNISTFMLEMRETAFICNHATSRSLILMDELGRATSNEDGVAIAWATSEYLLKKRAMTFFVTHYPQLTTLANIYPSVQNIHLEAYVSSSTATAGNNSGSSGGVDDIRYAHKARPGACSVSTDYGIDMAAACGWPVESVVEARSAQARVEAGLPNGALCSDPQLDDQAVSDQRTKASEALATLVKDLRGLVHDDAVDSHCLMRARLRDLQERHVTSRRRSPAASLNDNPKSDGDAGGIAEAMKQLLRNGSPRRGDVSSNAGCSNMSTQNDGGLACLAPAHVNRTSQRHGHLSLLEGEDDVLVEDSGWEGRADGGDDNNSVALMEASDEAFQEGGRDKSGRRRVTASPFVHNHDLGDVDIEDHKSGSSSGSQSSGDISSSSSSSVTSDGSEL